MCETCIKNIVKFSEPIECKICHRDSEVKTEDAIMLSINKNKLYELFPVNIFMLGELTLQQLEVSHFGQANPKTLLHILTLTLTVFNYRITPMLTQRVQRRMNITSTCKN